VTRRLTRAAGILLLAATLLASGPARADAYLDDWHPYQTYWGLGWNLAVPVGSLRTNFIDNPGWLGGTFTFRIGVAGRLAVGFDGTWNWFDETFSVLEIHQPNLDFTGPAYRRLSSFTALATAHYYFTQSAVQPYLGVGVGGVWISTLQQVVNRSWTSEPSGFAVAGEAGLLFNVAPRLGLYMSGRYQLNLVEFANVKNPQWAAGQAGLAYYF
jgi:opacity protein-like surface antigen